MDEIGRSTYTRMDVLKYFYKLQGGERLLVYMKCLCSSNIANVIRTYCFYDTLNFIAISSSRLLIAEKRYWSIFIELCDKSSSLIIR
jgi:hypothetical protein